jgi:hypothetical protein
MQALPLRRVTGATPDMARKTEYSLRSRGCQASASSGEVDPPDPRKGAQDRHVARLGFLPRLALR